MTNNTIVPTYPVEVLEAEIIVLETPILQRDRSRFSQFINNVALSVISGTISEQAVFEETTPAVYEAVQVAITRFDELSRLHSSRSTLEGVDEYLHPDSFSFRNTPNGYTK